VGEESGASVDASEHGNVPDETISVKETAGTTAEAIPEGPTRPRWPMWLALGIVAGLLAAGGAYFGLMSYQGALTTAHQHAFETAEEHCLNALESLISAQGELYKAETTPGNPFDYVFKQIAESTQKDLDKAAAEVAAAEKATALVEDETARAALTGGIEKLKRASMELGKSAKLLPPRGPLMDLAQDVTELANTADETRENTILLINKRSWPAAAARNKQGLSEAAVALKKLDQMEKLRLEVGTAGSGIAQAQQEMRLTRTMLALQTQLIASGRSSRTSAFNSSIDKYNDLAGELDDVSPAEFYGDEAVFLEAPMTMAANADASLDRAAEKLTEAREAFLTSQ